MFKTGASKDLAACEAELTGLLVEFEAVSEAWHTEPLALKRADLGDRFEDLLDRIADLEKLIATTPARTLADAAVKLRRLFAGVDGELHTQMLASALTIIEAKSAASPA